MKAIILSAGKGRRLRELTLDTPKPMLPVNGKPILEIIINWLKKNGITDIGINLYTKPDQFFNYFGNGYQFGVDIHFVVEPELSGTAGGVLKFTDWIGCDEYVLVVYGDILTDQNFMPLLNTHINHDAFATLLMHRRKISNSFIEIDNNFKIINFQERPEKQEITRLIAENKNGFFVNSAVQILSRRALKYIKDNQCFDLPKDVYMPNCHVEDLYGIELNGKRVAIDSPERYKLAQTLFTDL